ncbi:hypothetical protein GHT06_011099 [Daphnia sinensis]|uniref:Uncharacterized protein n=1 Tax=Daphnia sinensis TaxID=1820382 RepID=A0AAD5LJ15_9CRUS|nr:hypothetical protein GHT06_011099 [Daphnia sinensis]
MLKDEEEVEEDGKTIKRRARRTNANSSVVHQRSDMLHRFSLVNLAAVLAVLALSAVQQVPAAAVERDGRTVLPSATITVLSTSLLPGASTSTLLTKKVCGTIDGGVSSACRRKRQFWIDVPILIAQDPETASYIYQQFQPSPVFSVEPTQVVQFRDNFDQPSAFIDSSLDENTNPRLNGAILSPVNTIRTSLLAIASNVISSFLTPTVTFTSVVSGYSSTTTTTIFTTTQTYTVAGCIPDGIEFSAC